MFFFVGWVERSDTSLREAKTTVPLISFGIYLTMLNLKPIFFVPFYVILIFPATLWAGACEQANSLVFQVLKNKVPNSKPLLQRALTLCPNHAIAHNTLAVISEHERDYHNALYHYQQTVKYSPDYFQAWVGMGDIYYQQKQLPLSLESYLQACTHYHPHAPQPENHEKLLKRTRQRVVELKSRIRDVNTGSVLQVTSFLPGMVYGIYFLAIISVLYWEH